MLGIAYVAVLLVMGIGDGLWLGLLARDFYQRSLGHLMADRINVPAALAFYLLYAAGLAWLAVRPALETGDWRGAAGRGLLLGLFAYLTYDLSNLATLKRIPLSFALVDILWGGALSALAAAVATVVAWKLAPTR